LNKQEIRSTKYEIREKFSDKNLKFKMF